MEEAKNLAQDHLPSVFSLIGILENMEEIKSALVKQDVSFSFAIGLEPESPGGQGGAMSNQNRLFSSIGNLQYYSMVTICKSIQQTKIQIALASKFEIILNFWRTINNCIMLEIMISEIYSSVLEFSDLKKCSKGPFFTQYVLIFDRAQLSNAVVLL